MTIAAQMGEVLAHHFQVRGAGARERAIEWLERVRIPEAARRLTQYPHELSGGMRQRVMIAMAMMGEPALLIADEPTTALDATVQAQVLDLIEDLRKDTSAAVALITHDMGVIARMAQRVAVMRRGEVVETGAVEEIYRRAEGRLHAHAAEGGAAHRWRRAPHDLPPRARARRSCQRRRCARAFPDQVRGRLVRQDQAIARRRWRELRAAARARRWASSAKAAAASPRWRARSCNCCRARRGR